MKGTQSASQHFALVIDGDAMLLARCSGGSPAAWRELFEEVRPLVRTVAGTDFRLSLDDQEDVFQLVCLKLYRSLHELKNPLAFRNWLRCVTRRAALDFLRQRRSMASLDVVEEESGPVALESEPLAWEDRTDLRVDLERALDRLPEKYRAPVRLYVLDGEEQEDVSRILGRPRSTVASQIHRGLARLRRSLTPLEAA